MLTFDEKTINKLKDVKVSIEDKIYLFVRHIDKKYFFFSRPNYWEDVFDSLDNKDRIFYKVWLWLTYIEYESLISPIREFEEIFGSKRLEELLTCLKNGSDGNQEILRKYYSIDGEAGQIFLDWAIKNVKTNYNNG